MTDLQVKYWDLQSQNKLREAQGLKALSDVDLNKAKTEEVITLTPYEANKLKMESKHLLEDINLIRANTSLSEAKKAESIANTINKYTDSASKISSEIRNWVRPNNKGSSGGLTQIIALLGKVLLA